MRPLPLLLVPALLAASMTASAEELPPKIALRLEYKIARGIPRCPAADEFVDYLGERFGYRPITDDAEAQLVVDIHFKKNGHDIEADLVATDKDGGEKWREVYDEGVDCMDLVRDVALLVRIRLGPISWRGAKEPPTWLAAPQPAPPPAPPPPSVPPPAAPPPPAPPKESPAPPTSSTPTAPAWFPRPELAAAFLAAPGATPTLALGGSLGVGVRWPFALVAGEVRLLEGLVPITGPYAEIQPSIVSGMVSGCVTPLSLLVCGVGGFARYGGSDDGVRRVTSKHEIRGWFGVRVAGDWHPWDDRLALRFSGEVVVATGGGTFATSGAGSAGEVLWTLPVVVPTLGIAAVYTLPVRR